MHLKVLNINLRIVLKFTVSNQNYYQMSISISINSKGLDRELIVLANSLAFSHKTVKHIQHLYTRNDTHSYKTF